MSQAESHLLQSVSISRGQTKYEYIVYRITYVAKYLPELLNNAAGFALSLSVYMTNSMLCVKICFPMEYRNGNGNGNGSGHF